MQASQPLQKLDCTTFDCPYNTGLNKCNTPGIALMVLDHSVTTPEDLTRLVSCHQSATAFTSAQSLQTEDLATITADATLNLLIGNAIRARTSAILAGDVK